MNKKILVVDNNKFARHLFTDFLEKQGDEVKTAEDGLRALDILDSFRPSVVFVDLVMPNINGEKFCKIVRKMPEFDSMALVIVSAIAVEEKLDFAALGANACIAKGPFDEMKKHILTVLDHLEKDDHQSLRNKIYGIENLYEREITKELLSANRHFEILLNNINDGFLELTSDANIIFANKAAAMLLQCPEEKLLSTSFPEFLPKQHRAFIKELIQSLDQQTVQLGEDEPIILHKKHLMMKFVPFFEQERKIIIILVHDITARKQAEFALQSHRDKLEKIVEERTAALREKNSEYEEALAKVKMLSGLLPICASCKKIRDDKGYWKQIETYICDHSEADFSHGLCPSCCKKLYPDYF